MCGRAIGVTGTDLFTIENSSQCTFRSLILRCSCPLREGGDEPEAYCGLIRPRSLTELLPNIVLQEPVIRRVGVARSFGEYLYREDPTVRDVPGRNVRSD